MVLKKNIMISCHGRSSCILREGRPYVLSAEMVIDIFLRFV